MDANELTKRIPDVWFDWYARLIPGCIGITTYLWLHTKSFDKKGEDIFLLLFLAYIIGHIVSPFSSKIINLLNKGLEPRTNRLVSKAYSETISMSNSAIITAINIIYGLLSCTYDPEKYRIGGFLFFIFLLATYFRAQATADKIKKL